MKYIMIIATFIKIGRAGKCVDNAGGGGNVDVCIDTPTGEIKYAIQYDGMHDVKDIEKLQLCVKALLHLTE